MHNLLKRIIMVLFILLIFNSNIILSFASSNIIKAAKNNDISPIQKELHNWEKVGDGKYEVYNMFGDEIDGNGNYTNKEDYFKYTMDKNNIKENEKDILVNNFDNIILSEQKEVLNKYIKDYYKKLYTQADFMKFSINELKSIQVALNDVCKLSNVCMAKQNLKNYFLEGIEYNYHFIKANQILLSWSIENYNKNVNNFINKSSKYESQFFTLLKYWREYIEDYSEELENNEEIDYSDFSKNWRDYLKNIGAYNLTKQSKLIDDNYYDLEIETKHRVAFEYSMIDELKNGDEIKVYKYKKGLKDDDYYLLKFEGMKQYDDIFIKKDKYMTDDKYEYPGYSHYKEFFKKNKITYFAEFECLNSENVYDERIGVFDYVALKEDGFSSPLFRLGYIGAQLYGSPYEYELFYDREFISTYYVKILKNALKLRDGGDLDDCITCFCGGDLNEKLELIDEKNAMNDIGIFDNIGLYSYILYNDKNYITGIVDVAHSEGDIPSSYGQYNKPLTLQFDVEKDTKVYEVADINSKIIYKFDNKVHSGNNEETSNKYHLGVNDKIVNDGKDEWVNISYVFGEDRGGWHTEFDDGWIILNDYKTVKDENVDWYPYS